MIDVFFLVYCYLVCVELFGDEVELVCFYDVVI